MNKLINWADNKWLLFYQLQLPPCISSEALDGKKRFTVGWFLEAYSVMTNFRAKATNSIAKGMNSIANWTNSIAKVMNSFANGMNSIVKVTKSIAKICNNLGGKN